MKTDQEAARDSVLGKYFKLDCHEDDFELGFLAGCAHKEKQMLENAASGFEEWWKEEFGTDAPLSTSSFSAHIMDAWKAAKLSSQAEIKKREERIKQLEVNLNTCKNDYWFMINLLEKYSSTIEEGVKDCIERMKFMKGLFNILEDK